MRPSWTDAEAQQVLLLLSYALTHPAGQPGAPTLKLTTMIDRVSETLVKDVSLTTIYQIDMCAALDYLHQHRIVGLQCRFQRDCPT